MSPLTAFASSLILITKVYGLAPPLPVPAINIESSSTPSTLQLLNFSSTPNDFKLVNASNDPIKCEGKRFGYNLNRASCEEVWRKIPTDSVSRTFGARSKAFFERPLPYRYLSEDGLCAIEINHMYHAWKDDASDHDISVAAKSILDTCVLRDATKKVGNMPIGGIRGYVGMRSGLNVKIASYSPHVLCDPGPAQVDETACSNLVNVLPIGIPTFAFIRKAVPGGPKSVLIPIGGAKKSSGACTAIIDFEEGETDRSSWYELWMAAAAVNEMCIKKGRAGTAFELGQGRTLKLSLAVT